MIQPLGSRIKVTPKILETKTNSGIVLPGNDKKVKNIGIVQAVGTGRVLDNGTKLKPEVEVGDEVIFAQYAGTHIDYQGEDVFLIDERDILAVIKKPTPEYM